VAAARASRGVVPLMRGCLLCCVVLCCCFDGAASREHIGERKNFAFRYNLLLHIGDTSSLRPEESPGYPSCYSPLLYPINFEVCVGCALIVVVVLVLWMALGGGLCGLIFVVDRVVVVARVRVHVRVRLCLCLGRGVQSSGVPRR